MGDAHHILRTSYAAGLINTYNRMNVITRQPGGGYQPGQWG